MGAWAEDQLRKLSCHLVGLLQVVQRRRASPPRTSPSQRRSKTTSRPRTCPSHPARSCRRKVLGMMAFRANVATEDDRDEDEDDDEDDEDDGGDAVAPSVEASGGMPCVCHAVAPSVAGFSHYCMSAHQERKCVPATVASPSTEIFLGRPLKHALPRIV